jgi:hypothetical protein
MVRLPFASGFIRGNDMLLQSNQRVGAVFRPGVLAIDLAAVALRDAHDAM